MDDYSRDQEHDIDEYDENNRRFDNLNMHDDFNLTKKNMPIKPHMKKIEDIIAELKRDLNENRKNGQILRSENQSLEHKTKEKCNEITKLIIDDLANFDKELKRVVMNDKSETDFFKQQVNALNQDKVKLQQNVLVMDTRMKSCETDIGVEY